MITSRHTFGLGVFFILAAALLIFKAIVIHDWPTAIAALIVLLLGAALIGIEVTKEGE